MGETNDNQGPNIQFNPDTVSQLVSNQGFLLLNDDLKSVAIKTAYDDRQNDREKGSLDKLFGGSTKRISLYIAWTICMALLVIGLIYILIPPCYKVIDNLEFWKLIAPIITATLGFIFGKQE